MAARSHIRLLEIDFGKTAIMVPELRSTLFLQVILISEALPATQKKFKRLLTTRKTETAETMGNWN